ncbi:hypothetical protein EG328_009490 [Venturia inaequalis]|uniref:Uncharacterized protein n=1 Tax=Venturia inaequalis TaxID=5025 RepID=A0A8H3YM10_VENIN|nr:hypothetical protein EG328_009490 [Venturia inaequalis]
MAITPTEKCSVQVPLVSRQEYRFIIENLTDLRYLISPKEVPMTSAPQISNHTADDARAESVYTIPIRAVGNRYMRPASTIRSFSWTLGWEGQYSWWRAL